MQRISLKERQNWQSRAEALGFFFHSVSGGYWNEAACYSFSAAEIDEIEEATNELHKLCLKAVAYIIEKDRFADFGIPAQFIPMIIRSWEQGDPSLYGRFDLAYDGKSPPKMLEYNADTPTALLEASVMQWDWLQATHPRADQFNSLHDRLCQAWRSMTEPGQVVHFACIKNNDEDLGTVEYIRDTAIEAGVSTRFVYIEDIAWNSSRGLFLDPQGDEINTIYKLYPWEWMTQEEFAPYLLDVSMRIIEPAWKMLLSNKALCAILWEMFPEHKNLLPAYFSSEKLGSRYVKKPLLSREGANVSIKLDGREIASSGDYANGAFVYQAFAELPKMQGRYPVIGSWVIAGEAAGLGVREDEDLITKNTSWFVPHMF